MSLDLAGKGQSDNWNYAKQNEPGYSETLVGTVLALQEMQKRDFTLDGRPGRPSVWPDGNPVFNIRMTLATQDGDIKTFTFGKAGKAAREGKKKSIHVDLSNLVGGHMLDLIGKTIQISTQPGSYGQGNPRPWTVQLVNAGPFQANREIPEEYTVPQLLCEEFVHGGQMMQQPMMQQQYQQPMYQQQPMMQQQQPMYQQQPVQQPMMQQPMQQQPMAQPMQQPMVQQQQAPAMDPNVAAAMQQLGATNVQQVQAVPQQVVGNVYDESIPF